MIISWPDNTEETIDQIRNAIGRQVDFIVVASSVACSACDLDPVANTSLDSFCPVCSGDYWIPVYSSYSVVGHITWGNSEVLKWTPGGQYFDGDCRVQVKFTPELIAALEKTKYVDVDGSRLTINAKNPRGVKNINRIILDLDLEERNNG